MKLAVTGSRSWWRRGAVWIPLTRLLTRYGEVTVFNGKCPRGADPLATEWVDEYREEGASEEPFEADWERLGGYAGHERNGRMIAAEPQLLLVFANPCQKRTKWCPKGEHPSHGTANCVDQARDAGIPVKFSPYGMSW